jgi:hypothetical protein
LNWSRKISLLTSAVTPLSTNVVGGELFKPVPLKHEAAVPY